MATKTKREKAAAKVLTPGELQDAIHATLMEYFPHCEHASVAFVPAPGVPPLELQVAGDVFGEVGLSDDWYTGDCNANFWTPDESAD